MSAKASSLRAAFLTATALTTFAGMAQASAQDATWRAAPGSSNYAVATNWDTNTRPTGTAYFGASNTSTLSLVNAVAHLDGWTFNADAENYAIISTETVQFSGAGIVINGGSLALTVNNGMEFRNASSAGSATIYGTNSMSFSGTSTAATSTIILSAGLYFSGFASAGSSTITNGLLVAFSGNSTASNASIDNTTSNSRVDFSSNTGPLGDSKLSIGSIAGTGRFMLGSRELTVGGNNQSTTVTGVISNCDGGCNVFGAVGGSLVKTGTGTLTLSGLNTYTGPTTVNAGTLAQGTAGAFTSAYTVAAGATLNIGGYATAIKSLAGAGNVSLGSGTLTAGSDNSATTFSGVISGSGGFAKSGTGRTDLTGVNTYTGSTTVIGGALSVNGSIATSSLTYVAASGTLGGNGTVGSTLIDGGALAPGNSIGTLSIAGNLAFSAASRYMVEVSPSNADRVNVTGTASLGGATVNASFANGSYISKQYTILNAAGGVSGTFRSQVNTNLPANFASKLSYDAKNAYLDLTLNFVPTPTPPLADTATPAPTPPPTMASFGNGLSSNQNAVGDTLQNYFNRNGGIPLAFGALTPTGLTQVSGETVTGTQQPGFTAATQFVGALSDPTTAGRGADASGALGFAEEGDAMNAYAAGRKRSGRERDAFAMITKAAPMVPAFVPRWSIWASGFGGTQTTDGNTAGGTNRSSSRIGGVAVGADYWPSPQTVAGFALAGGATNFSVTGGGAGRSDLFQVGGFVRHNIASAYVTATAAYGWQSVSTDRMVGAEQLRAQFDTNSYTARLEAGNRFVTPWLGGIGVTPYAAAQVTYLDLPSYAETSAAGSGTFALAYAGKGIASPRSELGLRSDKSFAVQDALLTLRGRAAWAHDYNTERSASATFQSLPGASFVVNGARPASDAALTTAEAELRFASGISIGATFEGEFSEVTRSYAGKGMVRYAW